MDMIDLEKLIAATRDIVMTPEQEAEQRRSFAYGNTRLSNPSITREMIEDADARIQSGERQVITWT